MFDQFLNNVTVIGYKCILYGDFNINFLYHFNNNVKKYIDLLASNVFFFFYPCINKPTQINKQSATLIDHTWTNDILTISGSWILMTDVTDHFAPIIHCKGKNELHNPLTCTYRYNNTS